MGPSAFSLDFCFYTFSLWFGEYAQCSLLEGLQCDFSRVGVHSTWGALACGTPPPPFMASVLVFRACPSVNTVYVRALTVFPVQLGDADWLCSLRVTERGEGTAFLHNRVTGQLPVSDPPSDPRVLLCGPVQAAYQSWAQLRVCRQRCPPCRTVAGSEVVLGSAEGLQTEVPAP